MERMGTALVTSQERRAHLHREGASIQRGTNVRRASDATGGQQRHINGRSHG